MEKWVSKIVNEGVVDCVLAIVGTKLDLVQQNPALRKVDSAQAKQYAQSIGAIYAETSAKSGLNVENVFQKTIDTAIKTLLENNPNAAAPQANKNVVNLEDDGANQEKKESGGCC